MQIGLEQESVASHSDYYPASTDKLYTLAVHTHF